MSIITISRPFCSQGETIAKKLAETLGYECISREILMETSDQFNVPEIKLAKALHDSPSFFEKLTHTKQKHITFFRAALLNHLKKDNIVYHGLAGHFFLQDIPHVLKIRTLSTMEDRIREEVRRENVSPAVARKRLINDDKERHSWSTYLYGIDTSDPELYDLVLNLKQMSIDDCVETILNTVRLDAFQSTPESLEILEDMAFAANIKAAIADKYHDAAVRSRAGNVAVDLLTPVPDPEKTKSEVESMITAIPGVKKISVTAKSSSISRTAMHKITK